MTPVELLDALESLGAARLEELIHRFLPRNQHAYVRLKGAAPSDTAADLVTLAEQDPALRADLEVALGAGPGGRPDPVAEWLALGLREHRSVRVLGFQDRYKIRLTLEDIYVPIRVRAGRRVKDHFRADREGGAIEESREVGLAEALGIAGESEGVSGLAILGDPGAGKTTLLKHLFVRVARDGSASMALPAELYPVMLRCSALAAEDRVPRGLERALLRAADRDRHSEAGRRLLESRRPLLFLLDGLDEVRDEATRSEVCAWLNDEVARWPGSRFVVTCRFAAWRREARLDNQFLAVDVQWLDEATVRDYVTRWFRAVERGLVGAGSREEADRRAGASAEKLLERVLDPRRQAHLRLREMTENPLLLSTLCLVHHADLQLPERRGDLYDRCISLLLETWAAEREGRPCLPDRPTRQVLQPLAWAMNKEQAREWPEAKVLRAIEVPLREVQGLGLTGPEFLARARDECGVLASKDLGSYEFFHLSFQEYLAAVHAQEGGLAAELAARAGDPWWRETIFLAVARPGVFAPFVRDLAARGELAKHQDLLRAALHEAIRVDPAPFLEVLDGAIRPRSWRGRLLETLGVRSGGAAGRDPATVRAVLDLLRDRPSPQLVERARRLAGHVDPGVCAAARAILGTEAALEAAPGPAPGTAWRERMTGTSFLWVPPGVFRMGSSKEPGQPGYDPEAYDDETPAHEVELSEGYWMAEHPVTNAQYGLFLAATRGMEPAFWRDRRFNAPDQPVVGVSFKETRAYCAWLSKEAGIGEDFRIGLPTEAEWEHAARGKDGRRYPWGKDPPTAALAVFGLPLESGAPSPVGGRPAGKSPFGCQDMAGNVWEWCLDNWRDKYDNMMTRVVNPCHLDDRGGPRVVRGGSWNNDPRNLRAANRNRNHPGNRNQNLGFRVVCRGSRRHMALEP